MASLYRNSRVINEANLPISGYPTVISDAIKERDTLKNKLAQLSKHVEVIDKLKKELEKRKVKVIVNSKVEEILVENGCVTGVRTENNIYECDKVILATGGKSYPSTGSTGTGSDVVFSRTVIAQVSS